MLRTRIVTAVFLFSAFFLALLYLPPLGWVVFATRVAAIAAWEWGALMTLSGALRIVMAIGFVAICAVIIVLVPAALGVDGDFFGAAWQFGRWFYIPSVAFWLLGVPCWMSRRWLLPKNFVGLAIGAIVILPTWLALVQLRQAGTVLLISIMAVVWLADIGAYVFGRRFGRHKLAPSISPGKTWEGAVGGGAVVIVYGFVLSYLPYNSPLVFAGRDVVLLLVLVLLTTISVIGDLFESLLKRQAGLKDSSNVLPGHGGVLDRIDSLTSTLPLVTLLWLTSLH